ncbi:hypothetical protein OAC86_01280 [bacterium]|nr:hypothetical protein [bacterium]
MEHLHTTDFNYTNTLFMEFYSMRGSDAVSVIHWIMQNSSDEDQEIETIVNNDTALNLTISKVGSVYHINEAGMGWISNNASYVKGLVDGFVSHGATLIIFSYYDHLPSVSLVGKYPDILSMLANSVKIYLIRDIDTIIRARHLKIKELLSKKYSHILISKLYENNDDLAYKWHTLTELRSAKLIKINYEKIISSSIYRDKIATDINLSNPKRLDQITKSTLNLQIELTEYETLLLQYFTTILSRRKEGYIKTAHDATKLLLIGDSHAEALSAYEGSDFYFDRGLKHGSTARGCINPDSKTRAFHFFNNGIKLTDAKHVVISLGEVDCGFMIWLKHQHDGTPINQLFEESMTNLMRLIKEHVMLKFNTKNIFVMTIPPAFIVTNTDKRHLNGDRAAVDPSLNERKNLISKWNKRLLKESKKIGFNLIDINNKIIDKHTGEINSKYRTPYQWNHHLWPYTCANLFIDEINKNIHKK